MKLVQSNICVTSYNSTGLGPAVQNFLSTLSLFSNILCIQEHFLLDGKDKKYSNTDKLRKICGDKYDMFIVPAYKDISQVSKGRGIGGLATLWDKCLTKYVSQIKCSSTRLQATKFDFPSGSLLILNTYFPCDPRTNNFNEDELLKLLAEIKMVMNSQACFFNLVLGDLNSHFSRQTRFTTIIEEFFSDINFFIYWENTDGAPGHVIHPVDFTHQQFNNRQRSISIIDHFVSNATLFNSVKEAGVVHYGENPSNHSPIYARFQFGDIDISKEKAIRNKRVNWVKSSKNAKSNYSATLNAKLDKLEVPECVLCRDIHCSVHIEQMENYTMAVLEAVQEASQECLAYTGGGKNHSLPQVVPGWSVYVKPYAEESKFWCALWFSAGKPANGALYEAMLFSKRQYKFAVRRLKRANNKIQNDNFVQSILTGNVNIFKEIKKVRGSRNSFSTRIDDQVGSSNISNKFANIYKDLYNQHEHGDTILELEHEITERLGDHNLIDAEKISVQLVEKALKQMKAGKNDADFDFQSDCFINGPQSLIYHLANLLRTFVIHGSVPYFILVCTLLPIVKDNLADVTSSDNYRAIASGSLLLKLLDVLILLLEGDKMTVDQLQFGFESGASTTMCSWTATTVIEHYNQRGNPVFACAMDLSKAFDLVEWVSLFRLLIEKGISLIYLRILIFIYKEQTCNVKWNSCFSEMFVVTNGVRQGAVSSPLLFSIYIDGLIVLLRKSGLGCRIDKFFLGVLGYADDLLLLSASRSGLQAMVAICEKFAKLRKLKFSTNPNPVKSKTKCVIFTKVKAAKVNVAPIILNGNPLPWVESVKHLGNTLQSDNSMRNDTLVKRGKLIGKINALLQEFHYVDPALLMKILCIHVTAFYGSSLWDLYSKEVIKIFSSWNVTVRNVFKLPRTTHRYFIEPVSGHTHPKTMLCTRMVRFLETLLICSKGSVRYLASIKKNDRRSLLGSTISKIVNELDIARNSLVSGAAKNMLYFPPPNGEKWRIPLLSELLDVREERSTVPGFEPAEIESMINEICCN